LNTWRAWEFITGKPRTSVLQECVPAWFLLAGILRGLLLTLFYLPVSAAFLPPDVALAATLLLAVFLSGGIAEGSIGRISDALTTRPGGQEGRMAVLVSLLLFRFVLLRGFFGFETGRALLAGGFCFGMELALAAIRARPSSVGRQLLQLFLTIISLLLLAGMFRGGWPEDPGLNGWFIWLMPGAVAWSCARLLAAIGWLTARSREVDIQVLNPVLLAPAILAETGLYLAFLLLRYNFLS